MKTNSVQRNNEVLQKFILLKHFKIGHRRRFFKAFFYNFQSIVNPGGIRIFPVLFKIIDLILCHLEALDRALLRAQYVAWATATVSKQGLWDEKDAEGDGKPPCFEYQKHGTCKYGDNCRYAHDVLLAEIQTEARLQLPVLRDVLSLKETKVSAGPKCKNDSGTTNGSTQDQQAASKRVLIVEVNFAAYTIDTPSRFTFCKPTGRFIHCS